MPRPAGDSVAWVSSPWYLSMRAHTWFGFQFLRRQRDWGPGGEPSIVPRDLHLSGAWGGAAAPVWEAERTGTPFPREAGFPFSAGEVGLEFQAPLTGWLNVL